MPVLSRLCGYFPGKALGVLGDLPKDVALELARWCRHPEYMLGHQPGCPGFASLHAPAISLTTEADHVFPRRSVEWLANRFSSPMPVQLLPSRSNQALGHFDFFDPLKGKQHWPEWLEAATQGRPLPATDHMRVA
jgi:predicted alpha/beta hydrolase